MSLSATAVPFVPKQATPSPPPQPQSLYTQHQQQPTSFVNVAVAPAPSVNLTQRQIHVVRPKPTNAAPRPVTPPMPHRDRIVATPKSPEATPNPGPCAGGPASLFSGKTELLGNFTLSKLPVAHNTAAMPLHFASSGDSLFARPLSLAPPSPKSVPQPA